MLIAARCDGGAALGAGHVARCLPVAAALRAAGHEVVVVGEHDGVALDLLERAGLPRRPPAATPCGVPQDADAVLLDVYGLPHAEREEAASRVPLAAFHDGSRDEVRPLAGLVVDYHLDAGDPREAAARGVLAGPDYAPLDPRIVTARRAQRGGPTLVALGGSTAGARALEPLIEALRDAGHEAIEVAGALAPRPGPGVRHRGPLPGLHDALATTGVLCCGASVTAYEAAAAGVPALLAVLVDNQARVGRAFAALTPVVDVRGTGAIDARAAARDLSASRLPAEGPALVDGAGGARLADALLAHAAGAPAAPPLRRRPATAADADLLRGWRNDPAVRSVSGSSRSVEAAEHAVWLAGVLADPRRTLLVCEVDGAPVGTVRFDREADGDAEISITVAPAARGGGLGRRMIRECTGQELAARPEVRSVVARIHVDNAASRRAFGAAGYAPAGSADDWLRLRALR